MYMSTNVYVKTIINTDIKMNDFRYYKKWHFDTRLLCVYIRW